MDAVARDEMLTAFGATLGRTLDNPLVNFAAFLQLRAEYEPLIRGEFESQGLRLPRAYWDSFWLEVFPLAAPKDAGDFLGLLYGLTTSYGEQLREHVAQRHADGGNNVWEIFGLSGTGKSSVAMKLAHEFAPFKPGRVMDRVVFGHEDVVRVMAQVQAKEWVILDEQTRLSGQGSKTQQEELMNLEEQGRASQKNLMLLSPNEREVESQRVSLRTFAWSRARVKVGLLVRAGGRWLGHTIEDFSLDWVWQEYAGPKARHVQRAVTGGLRNKLAVTVMVNEAAADPEFGMILLGRGKPRPADFKMAVSATLPRFADSRTEAEVAKRGEFLAKNWERQKVGFKARWGVEPAPVWDKLAKVFYKEM